MIVDWRRQTLCKVGFYIECVLLVAKFFTHSYSINTEKKKPNTKKSEKNRFSTFMCNKWVDKLRLGCKIACLFNGDFHNTSEFCRKQCFSIEYDFRCFHSGIQNRFTTHCYLLTYQDISHQKKISRKNSIKNV